MNLLNNLTVSILGIGNSSFDKYLDLLVNPKIREVNIFYCESDSKSYNLLKNAYEDNKYLFHGKLRGHFLPCESFFFKYIQYMSDLDFILDLLPKSIINTLQNELLKSDMIILEITNDLNLLLAYLVYSLGISYILSISSKIMFFKSRISLLSKLLEKADIILVPDEDISLIISSEFQLNKRKIVLANVDWPSKFTYEKYLRDFRSEKLSEKLKKPQVCIVSPTVCYKFDDKPLSLISYYVDLIEKFLDIGFMVHLYTDRIVRSFSEPVMEKINDYRFLHNKFGSRFNIYSLSKELQYPNFYYNISKYDYGLLIPLNIDFNQKLYQYIPQTYYTYKMAKLKVLAPSKFTTKSLVTTNMNKSEILFFNNVKDVKKYGSIKKEEEKYEIKNFYSEFIDCIFKELHF